jgi:hypothetical protein
MTEDRGPTLAPAFSIAVPGDWIIIDIDLAQDVEVVQEIIDRRVLQGVIASESRDAAVALVARVASQAADDGVRFAAVLVVEEPGGPVIASITVTSILVERGEPDTGDWRGEGDQTSAERNEGPVQDDGPVELAGSQASQVVLPAGPAFRVESVMSYPISNAIDQEVYSVQYVVPVDEDGNVIVIVGMSPAIRRKGDLDAVFAEIAHTLEIDPAITH